MLKLLAFTIAMVVLPIGSYFVSRDLYFGGPLTPLPAPARTDPSRAAEKNLTPPAIIAATTANLILIGFVYIAMKEDRDEQKAEAEKKKQ